MTGVADPGREPLGPKEMVLDRAVVLISIDVEMAWGLLHRPDQFYRFDDERAVMGRLLDLLDRYEVPCTWAFVGHLLLDHCERVDGVAHPQLVRPSYDWFDGDWLDDDPCRSLAETPQWYAPDLAAMILERPTSHEIGCHSFSHLIAGDAGCSEEAFRSDLRHCRQAAAELGVQLVSYVYPRNDYGHEGVLAEEGYACFRGPRPRSATSTEGRLGRLADLLRPSARHATRPVRGDGVWSFPGTYLHDVGRVSRYPMRVLQARRRLRLAVRERSLFHIWFHPHNARHETEKWFSGLERLLADAARLRSDGELITATMGDLAGALGCEAVRS